MALHGQQQHDASQSRAVSVALPTEILHDVLDYLPNHDVLKGLQIFPGCYEALSVKLCRHLGSVNIQKLTEDGLSFIAANADAVKTLTIQYVAAGQTKTAEARSLSNLTTLLNIFQDRHLEVWGF
jgi:hypothetical protein